MSPEGDLVKRARRRKSPWNLVLFALIFALIPALWWASFQIMWRVHVAIYPAHSGHFSEFWNGDETSSSFLSSFLLLIPLLFASAPLAMIISNAAMRIIPPARRALSAEAESVGLSYAKAMRELLIASMFIVPPALILSALGAITLSKL